MLTHSSVSFESRAQKICLRTDIDSREKKTTSEREEQHYIQA